jgi:uncharacterized protein (TIGR02996 family)
MSEEDGFLRGLLLSPADTSMRLVYADWLEERGENTRAEFLRLAAQLASSEEVADGRERRRQRLQQLAVGLDPSWLAAATGLHVASVEVSLDFADAVKVSYADILEVSLDCCICRRCRRTVVFRLDGKDGTCTPSGHPFPGFLLRKGGDGQEASCGARYLVAYRYEPFVDAKHPEWRRPVGVPTWARVSFSVACPACGEQGSHSTQTNIARPWTCHCRCGAVLYREVGEMPMLSWFSAQERPTVAQGRTEGADAETTVEAEQRC